jgi:Meckel syndrome type 1 protein
MLRLAPLALLLVLVLLFGAGWTWPVNGPVGQGFSFDPAHPYAAGQHRGVDVAATAGAPVLAPASGVVSYVGTVPTSGKSLTIETPNGLAVTLTHLGTIEVRRNAAVAEGEVVGTVGPTGEPEVEGPYVHLGVRTAASPQGYLDPLSFLPAPVLAPPLAPPVPAPVLVPVAPPAAEAPLPAPSPTPARTPPAADPPAPPVREPIPSVAPGPPAVREVPVSSPVVAPPVVAAPPAAAAAPVSASAPVSAPAPEPAAAHQPVASLEPTVASEPAVDAAPAEPAAAARPESTVQAQPSPELSPAPVTAARPLAPTLEPTVTTGRLTVEPAIAAAPVARVAAAAAALDPAVSVAAPARESSPRAHADAAGRRPQLRAVRTLPATYPARRLGDVRNGDRGPTVVLLGLGTLAGVAAAGGALLRCRRRRAQMPPSPPQLHVVSPAASARERERLAA